jgi:ribosomal protein L12E/L44/L45/RPP1/RPP2
MKENESFRLAITFRYRRLTLLPNGFGLSIANMAAVCRQSGFQITAKELNQLEKGKHPQRASVKFWKKLAEAAGICYEDIRLYADHLGKLDLDEFMEIYRSPKSAKARKAKKAREEESKEVRLKQWELYKPK